jgi:hypothetical protein
MVSQAESPLAGSVLQIVD